MAIIKLTAPKTITTVPEQTKTVTELTINRIVDLLAQKKVKAFIEEIPEPVTLWEGAAYDAIGQWTDANVQARLLELYA
jgi:hypothetical protein